MMPFVCSACGACCREVNRIDELKHLALETGICRHLLQDNSCEIYAERPAACRVDESFVRVQDVMCIERWHELNYRSCLALMKIHEVPREKAEPVWEALQALR